MTNQFQNFDKNWKCLNFLPQEEKTDLFNQIKRFKYEPGQKLHEIDDLPPGLMFIVSGQVRLITIDEKNEPFTLVKYNEADFFGGLNLIRGISGFYYCASKDSIVEIIKADKFLELIEKYPKFLEQFLKVESWEVFDILNNRSVSQNFSQREKANWARNYCGEKKTTALFINKNSIPKIEKQIKFISSCSNIKKYPVGSEIINPFELKVLGRLPARIIPFDEDFNFIKDKGDYENLKIYNDSELESTTLQKDALEDWYGRIRDDGSFPIHKGNGVVDETLACLRMISRFFDLPFRKDVLRKVLINQHKNSKSQFIPLPSIAAILDLLGLRSTPLTPSSESIFSRLPMPSIMHCDGHPIVLWEHTKGEIKVSDPRKGHVNLKVSELFNYINSEEEVNLLYIEKNANTPKARFGLGWFVPSIKKHRNSLIQVIITSFFVQLLGLFNPLLIQQIIDAVISQGNYSSLNVLGTLLIAMAISQALLGSLRTYLFADTTNRIDITLGASIINHLLRLPLTYFARRPVGEVSSRIGELEKIRGFLTGTALTVMLDAIFSVIYIGVMLLYSVPLTLAALGVVPLFIILTILVSPIIRKQLREGAEANAKVQSHLVETLTGMETVKGQGMELPSEWRWEQLYGTRINAGFRNTVTSTAAGSANQFLGQLSGLIIIWYGAMLVLQGKLTLGQLIAFRILSGYVTSPLLRLASLWQNFQETALSLERLSDIVDHPEEIEISGQNLPPIPPIKGSILYEGVNFRFAKSGPMQILNVNFEIKAGSFIGIVGSSGSGKSTLLKLLTRLFNPENGVIKIDSYDISKIDLYSLRSQIGVVPQDSLLFEGSVQENISLTRPDATFEEIVDSAKVACAHEFIENLSGGYSTSVGERGGSLSGGQRQRMAIARMILKQPRLLILDEATSALDVDTEKRLTRNLAESFKDRTVLFITHGLGSLKNADKILVLDNGSLVEQGTHKELLKKDGRYAVLYRQQENI